MSASAPSRVPEAPAALLLVDDNPNNLVALRAVLEPTGCHLVQAQSGREALRELLARDFAAVLLDVMMPDMDGFETAALMKSRPATRDIPTLFLTAHPMSDDQLLRAYSAGAVDVLVKPFRAELVRAKVAVFVDLFLKRREVERQRSVIEASEARLRAILEGAPDAMVIVDESGVITQANAQVQRLFGYAVEELVGQRIEVLVPERYRAPHEHQRARYAAEPRTRAMASGMALNGRRRDGSEIPVEVSLSPFTVDGARFVCSSVRDISERRRLEEERNGLFQLSLDLLCTLTVDGEFRRVNPAATALLGWSQQEFETITWTSLLDGADRAQAERAAEALRTPGGSASFEGQFRCKDGGHRTLEWRAVRSTTHPLVYATARDTTARQLLERQLREKTRLAEAANEAKSLFLANMSHEIRTPMNGVLGIADLLLGTPLSPDQKHFVDLIKESGHGLLHIVNSILDFSKIEAGRVDLVHEPFELKRSVEQVVASLRPPASAKGLELRLRCDANLPEWVRGDSGRLRQVLLNLVGNAIKFTEVGHVDVDVDVQTAATARSEVRFTIRDTGIGIATEQHQLVFEPFSQVDSSAQRRFEGTGLGLSISSRLVTMMGGSLKLESELGRGSKFCVVLPFEAVDRAAPSPPQLAAKRVLVIEEDNVTRLLVLRILKSAGYVATTSRGPEAPSLLADEQFDAVLLDLHLPEQAGDALLESIRRASVGQGRRLAVVAMSGAPSGVEPHHPELVPDAVIAKPLRRDELLNALTQVLAR